jgi:uroporphyrinogen decarboxylase
MCIIEALDFRYMMARMDMTDTSSARATFEGLEVVAFESRHAPEMAALIMRFGGVPRMAPAVREAPLEEDAAALEFATELFAGSLDAVIFMTGVGARRLFEVLETRYDRRKIVQALAGITVVARGPKPVKVLRELQIPITITVPEPNTWREILRELDENVPAARGASSDQGPGKPSAGAGPRGFTLAGSRVAVQEYGVPNEDFLAALRERGVHVMRVPVYQWTLPRDLGPLREAIRGLVEGRARVALFTNSAQVEHLLRVAAEDGAKDQLLAALENAVVASVGPTCSEALVSHGIGVDLEPVHPKMGPLVQETAQQAREILKKKSGVRSQESEVRSQESGARSQESEYTSHNIENSESRVPSPESRVPNPVSRAPWADSRFLKACRLEAVDATPVWLMRQAGRYMKEYRDLRARVPFLELCKNPALVSEVTVTAAEKLGVDAAIIFADLLLIVEPLGLHLEYDKGEGPVISPAVRAPRDIDRLHEVNPEESLAYFYDGIRQTRSDLDPRLPLIGFAGCPFTLASYLIEGGGSRNYRHTKALMYRDGGAWRALMERLARSLARYINAQIDAGVQAVQVFDTWVGCLGPADYRDYVQPYTRMMLQSVKLGTHIIHFGTGTAMLLEAMREAGGTVMGVDSHVELDAAWERLGPGVGVQGNLDPIVLYGELDFIRGRAQRILDQAAGRPGHIFNLGHGLLPDTPHENVVALVNMVHDLSIDAHAKGHQPPRLGN